MLSMLAAMIAQGLIVALELAGCLIVLGVLVILCILIIKAVLFAVSTPLDTPKPQGDKE